jgi:ubiquinone/menaquinone biosynthesis C-methylase UbiE
MGNKNHSVCPWWLGYLLACPIRKLFQNPEMILKPYIKEDIICLDIGSAMGFFSLPMAKLVGENGKVICVDLQEKMIASLVRRAVKKGVEKRIETRVCTTDSLLINDLKDKIDFALASAVMHETPDQKKIFSQVYNTLKPGAVMFVAEPAGHVSEEAFKKTVALAEEAGFKVEDRFSDKRNFTIVLRK